MDFFLNLKFFLNDLFNQIDFIYALDPFTSFLFFNPQLEGGGGGQYGRLFLLKPFLTQGVINYDYLIPQMTIL